jgi:hypothetical protein
MSSNAQTNSLLLSAARNSSADENIWVWKPDAFNNRAIPFLMSESSSTTAMILEAVDISITKGKSRMQHAIRMDGAYIALWCSKAACSTFVFRLPSGTNAAKFFDALVIAIENDLGRRDRLNAIEHQLVHAPNAIRFITAAFWLA